MACETLRGRTVQCKDSVGGIRTVYFTDFGLTVTEGSEEIITDLTSASAAPTFSKYDLKGSSAFNQNVVFNERIGMGNFEQDLTLNFSNLNTQTNYEIKKLFNRKLQAVVHDNTGKAWFVGYKNGIRLEGGGTGTGASKGDKVGYDISFRGSEESLANYLTGSTIDDPFAGMATQPVIETGSGAIPADPPQPEEE